MLGLRRDTQRDDVSMGIKLNYGEKVKGAYAEEDVYLECPTANLPQKIKSMVLC